MSHAGQLDTFAAEPLVSVIIPALNEGETLRATLAAIRSATIPFEIIVVDAGSRDETVAIAEEAGARVECSPRRQRAYQLNLGARRAQADTLLFVHADTILPANALGFILRALQNPEVVGGAFARCYDSPSPILRATCALAALRNHTLGWHLGDQAMFVRGAAFFPLGGFREVDCFEDLDFSRRLKSLGRVVTLQPAVISSPRRFEQEGPARRTLRDFGLTIRYLAHGLPVADTNRQPSLYEARERLGSL